MGLNESVDAGSIGVNQSTRPSCRPASSFLVRRGGRGRRHVEIMLIDSLNGYLNAMGESAS